MNSGIIHLENFVESTNLLPSDVIRTLGYIRDLDERIRDLKEECQGRQEQFAERWDGAQPPLPQEARDEFAAIDRMHADLLHLEAEKGVFARQLVERNVRHAHTESSGGKQGTAAAVQVQGTKLEHDQEDTAAVVQVEDIIRRAHDELDSAKASLATEVPHPKAHPDSFVSQRMSYPMHQHGLGGSHASIPHAPHHPQPQFQSAPALSQRSNHSQDFGYDNAAFPDSMQQSGGSLMLPPRKATPKSLRQRTVAEQQQQQPIVPGSMQPVMGMHPQQIQRGPRQTSMPGHMMPHYMQGGMYPYATHPQAMGVMHGPDGGVMHTPGQFFVPVDPSMRASAKHPQAVNGRLLTQADINNALVNKQAELLWPDDNLWYLIKITSVDVEESRADIVYLTGETENGLNLEEIAIKEEMRIIPG